MNAKLYDVAGKRVLAEITMHISTVELVIWPGKHEGDDRYEPRFFIRDPQLIEHRGAGYVAGFREAAVTATVSADKGPLPK